MGIGGELIGDVEQLLVAQTLRRKALFRMIGEESQCWRAEQEIQNMYQDMNCLLLPSATISLSMILELLDLEPGQEVLITPFGWVSNWSCIKRAGLIPRFLPLNDRLQLNVGEVADRMNDRTGAVIVTHLLGRGQQAVGEIAKLCADRNIHLLEDIAQSFGISIGGRRAGTFGAASWCSLNHHKMLSAGDGGFALVRDERIFTRLCTRHDQGNEMRNGKRRRAEVLEPGLSLRVSELTAATLRAQLARFHLIRTRILALHRAVATACEDTLGLELITPHEGDLPFTVFFNRPTATRYTSLADAGWHIAANVAWLTKTFEDAARIDPALAATIENLESISAVGSGFIDSYHGVPLGLHITDRPAEIPKLVSALKEML